MRANNYYRVAIAIILSPDPVHCCEIEVDGAPGNGAMAETTFARAAQTSKFESVHTHYHPVLAPWRQCGTRPLGAARDCLTLSVRDSRK